MLSVTSSLGLVAATLLSSAVIAAPVSLASVVRAESCSNGDTDCWNRNAILFTNMYRQSRGQGNLVPGPKSMLDNAVRHSYTMARNDLLTHQNLGAAGRDVGCDLFVNRENIAMFGGQGTFSGKRAARQFVDQWINSAPHRANILGANDGDSVVVGIAISDGSTWGTQVRHSSPNFGRSD